MKSTDEPPRNDPPADQPAKPANDGLSFPASWKDETSEATITAFIGAESFRKR
jgi:hypothetical protein